MDPARVKAAQQELYAGEYFALSSVLRPAAEALVAAAGVDEGATVLDVAAGDGNVAVAAALRGATVVATDLAPVQVERGEGRTRVENVDVRWLVADAERLPFADDTFTHVLSSFGVVFAPRPEVAVAELVRVCRPGGVVALTAWPAGSFMAEATAAVRELSPPDHPFPDLELGWNDEDTIRARLRPYAARLEIGRRSLPFDPAVRSAAGVRDCGAVFLAARLEPQALAQLQARRAAIVAAFTGDDGIPRADYLVVLATLD